MLRQPLELFLAVLSWLAKHHLTDLFDDLGIRQGGDVAGIPAVGDRGQHPAHDLARAGLGHVWYDPDSPRPGDLADLNLDRFDDGFLDALGGALARF